MSQHSRPFGDLHKVRGPGAKLQQTETRQGQRRQLGLARNRQRQRGLVGAKGLKPGRQHAVNSLGLAERDGNRAGVDQAQTGVRTAWLGAKGVRWGAGPGQVRLGTSTSCLHQAYA